MPCIYCGNEWSNPNPNCYCMEIKPIALEKEQKMPQVSADLARFYADVWQAIDKGAPWFARRYGLCYNLGNWASSNKLGQRHPELYEEMLQSFEDAGLDKGYPFDTQQSYQLARRDGDQYTNPKRLQWIDTHRAKSLVEEEEEPKSTHYIGGVALRLTESEWKHFWETCR